MTSTEANFTNESPVAAGAAPLRGLRDMWPLPTALAGVTLAVLGMMALARSAPGPDFEGVLSDAATMIEHQQPGAALDVLNGPILSAVGGADVDHAVRARFHALRGDALFLAQRESGQPARTPSARANNLHTLEEYEQAAKLEAHEITDRRSAFIAETLLDLGRADEAAARVERLPRDDAARRHRLLKRIVEETLAGPKAFHPRAMGIIDRMRADTTLSEDDRLWALMSKMKAELAGARPDAVIDGLLPEVQRIENAATPNAGELFLLLGRAYLDNGEIETARLHLMKAEASFPDGDDRRGVVDVGLARIAQSRSELEEARDRFATAAERFPGSEAEAPALLGLGETEADLGHFVESVRAYAKLVEVVRVGGGGLEVTPGEVEQSLEQRHRSRLVAEDFDIAIRYAGLGVRAYASAEAPAGAVLRLAETHRALADHLVRGDGEEDTDAPARLARMEGARVEEARVHYALAGEAFRKHAAAAMVEQPEAASMSLWSAADSSDRAGDQTLAVQLFTEYVKNRRQDPRLLEAKYRLARCFQAVNEYKTAVALFEEILRENAASDEAFRVYVPLAQCYLLESGDELAEKAERLLLQVLDGRMFKPAAPQFRRALMELGQMYLRVGRYPDAIARLNESIERYPGAPELTRLRFDLADACRLSAAQIEKQLREAMPLSERTELEKLRAARLARASGLYEQVRAALDAQDPGRLSGVQRVILRNAVLYRGDCAFDLGDYDGAIRNYDAAAQRFASDPASLVPMVQIVNCYAAQGRWPEARTAHERARTRLKELPEDIWKSANVPMDRRHWERWLETSLRLEKANPPTAAGEAPLEP